MSAFFTGNGGMARMLALLICMVAAPMARAVIINSATGTDNTTSTGAGAGWNYVGFVGGPNASGVFLGEYNSAYWVLTAAHVGAGDFTLGSFTYTPTGFGEQIGGADLYLFQITSTDSAALAALSPANLPQLSLSTSTPADTTGVTMIGYGANRATSQTHWFVDTSTDPYTWTATTAIHANESGYAWAAGQSKRWGTNTISGTSEFDDGYGDTYFIETTFASSSADPNEAQAATGDSGGGVFSIIGGQLTLTGEMLDIAAISGQPANTAAYGNVTYSADISHYSATILSAVPEPGQTGLLVAAGGLLGLTWVARELRKRRTPAFARVSKRRSRRAL